jgi:peptide deformylase
VFINAQMLDESGQAWSFNEGCLSIPGVREDVLRKPDITITYLDEKFRNKKPKKYQALLLVLFNMNTIILKVFLFTDKVSALKKAIDKGKT